MDGKTSTADKIKKAWGVTRSALVSAVAMFRAIAHIALPPFTKKLDLFNNSIIRYSIQL